MSHHWDDEVDVVVVGSGGAALTGAYVAASAGLDTVVLESTDKLGGTTAYSGAGLWLPASEPEYRAGVEDSVELARTYYRETVGDRTPASLQEAYLTAAADLVAHLEKDPVLQFEWRPFPDYYSERPGGLSQGRNIFPLDLPQEELGDLLDRIRPPAPDDRLGINTRRPVLTGGQALIGRFLMALRATGKADVRVSSPFESFVLDEGAVVGVEAGGSAGGRRIRARNGVLLAAGGFERDPKMRAEHQSEFGLDGSWSMGGPGSVGRPIRAGIEIGAAVDLMDECWWSPAILLPDGSASFTLGFRAGIIVDGSGRRYANESLPYDRFGREMRAWQRTTGASGQPGPIPSYLIWDDRAGADLPAISTIIPKPPRCVEAGVWKQADTLDELADQIGVGREALQETVAEWNAAAAAGRDDRFRRGENAYDRFFCHGPGPNPCLVPIAQPPFHAASIVLGDLGTKGGLVTDERARVLRPDRSVISGLYAAGNTMASVSGECYPGPGTPIGTGMVFAYLAALDMA